MRDSKIGSGLLAVFAMLLIAGIGCTNYQIPGSGGSGEIEADCFSNCHIRNEGGTLINSEFYLWKDSQLTWELEATEAYTVDGQLPSSWFEER